MRTRAPRATKERASDAYSTGQTLFMLLKTGTAPTGMEFRMRTAAGDWKWIYCSGRVTERDLKGKVLWEKQVLEPLMAQRLSNGNTLITTRGRYFSIR
jgi:hypothetical protein